MKNKIIKWLLIVDENQELSIIVRELSRAVPVNRMLDDSGFFWLMDVRVADRHYLCVYDKNEDHTKKTKLLVSKIEVFSEGKSGLVDLDESDQIHMYEIAKQHMNIRLPNPH